MLAVAKKFRKVQISVRVNPHTLAQLDAIGEATFRNRSEMIDRAIEAYVQAHAHEAHAPAAHPPRRPRGE